MHYRSASVVVGRFQVWEFHPGHLHLLDTVYAKHGTMLVVLASSGGEPTPKNPLPFSVRENMILERYPKARVVEILDHPIGPDYWSRDLDALIKQVLPGQVPILYGSRDSFLDVYSGEFETVRIMMPKTLNENGTQIRKETVLPNNADARKALIWQAHHRFPIAYRTVDLAIENLQDDTVLLIGKNRHEGFCSFMGGYVGPFESDEEAVVREDEEEIPGITIGPREYIASLPIADPRYRDTTDGSTTSFFRAPYLSGTPQPGDDADRVEWVQRTKLIERLVPWHRPLGELLLTYKKS